MPLGDTLGERFAIFVGEPLKQLDLGEQVGGTHVCQGWSRGTAGPGKWARIVVDGKAMLRRAVILPLLCAAAVACTSLLGDFVTSAGPADAGSGGDSAPTEMGGDDAGAVVRAITSDVSVYVGQTATVDGSNSTTTRGALAFSWTVVLAPPGSLVATGNLAGAASAKASFIPDVGGEYDLEVTVSAYGSSDAHTAKVTAALPQVLFAQGAVGDSGQGSAYYAVADFDGGSGHPVVCPDVITGSSVPLAAFAAYTGRAYDYWEAPAGQPLKFAAFTVDFAPDAGLFAHLWSGTSASSCDAPPFDYSSAGFGPGRPFGSDPHFSPDGSRFVVFDHAWHIVTYAANASDGGSPQVVATYPVAYREAGSSFDPVGFGADAGYPFEPPRVEWTDNGLAWAQPAPSGWAIVTAPDIEGATPTPYMFCKGIVPREIAMLRDGTVIASYRPTPQSSENLYQLKPDAQQNCYREQQYTNLVDSGNSTATDFAVSPDGAQIAFLQIDTSSQDASPWTQGGSQLPGGYVYVVPVAGGTPALVSSDPAIYGPRWIAGGSALVFTRLDGVAESTGRPATSVVVAALDGGTEHVVAQGDGVTTFASTSGNAACGVSGGGPGAKSGAALWILVAAAGWGRRAHRPRVSRVFSRGDNPSPGHRPNRPGQRAHTRIHGHCRVRRVVHQLKRPRRCPRTLGPR